MADLSSFRRVAASVLLRLLLRGLNIRPIVINDTAVITLDIESRSHNYLVAIDGRSERMTEETRLIIRKAPHSIKIVKQRNQRYFSTLREKLMWGADQRER